MPQPHHLKDKTIPLEDRSQPPGGQLEAGKLIGRISSVNLSKSMQLKEVKNY
jgi:hypothetical protein